MAGEHELQEIDHGGSRGAEEDQVSACYAVLSDAHRWLEEERTHKAVRLAASLSLTHALRPHVAVMAACSQVGACEHAVWEVLGIRALRELGGG